MNPLAIVKLTSLMDRTSGSPDVKIGLIDGPVVTQHPDLAGEHLREIPGKNGATCTQASSATRPNSAQTYSTQSAVAAAKLMRMHARRHLPESPSTTKANAVVVCLSEQVGAEMLDGSITPLTHFMAWTF